MSEETTLQRLKLALARCAKKLKVEYDVQQPDALPNECWAEAEAAVNLLRELKGHRG